MAPGTFFCAVSGLVVSCQWMVEVVQEFVEQWVAGGRVGIVLLDGILAAFIWWLAVLVLFFQEANRFGDACRRWRIGGRLIADA